MRKLHQFCMFLAYYSLVYFSYKISWPTLLLHNHHKRKTGLHVIVGDFQNIHSQFRHLLFLFIQLMETSQAKSNLPPVTYGYIFYIYAICFGYRGFYTITIKTKNSCKAKSVSSTSVQICSNKILLDIHNEAYIYI